MAMILVTDTHGKFQTPDAARLAADQVEKLLNSATLEANIVNSNESVDYKALMGVIEKEIFTKPNLKKEFNTLVNLVVAKKNAAIISIASKAKTNRLHLKDLAAFCTNAVNLAVPEAAKPYRKRVFKVAIIAATKILEATKDKGIVEFGRVGSIHVMHLGYMRDMFIDKRYGTTVLDECIEKYALITALGTNAPIESYKKTIGMIANTITSWKAVIPKAIVDADEATLQGEMTNLSATLVYKSKSEVDADKQEALVTLTAGGDAEIMKVIKAKLEKKGVVTPQAAKPVGAPRF